MTNHSEHDVMFHRAIEDAVVAYYEILKDDPDIATADLDGFMRVMWSDCRDDRLPRGMSREDYRDAVERAYDIVHEQER